MEAADQYRESLPFEQVVKSGAVVVPSKSAGNAQLIVPGLLPRYWMDWSVRIEVK
jgi:hypothetical protein